MTQTDLRTALRNELAARDQAVAKATAKVVAERYAQAGWDAAVKYYTDLGYLKLPAEPDAHRSPRR